MLLLFLSLASIIWVAPAAWRAASRPPLHPLHLLVLRRCNPPSPAPCPYDSLYAVLHQGLRSFTIRVRLRDKVVSVSRLKACMDVDATSGNLWHRSRPQGPSTAAKPATARLGGLAATKQVLFSDLLVSSPSAQAPPAPVGFFLCPGLAAPSSSPQMGYMQRQRIPPTRLDLWPLLLQADIRAREGSPMEACFGSLLSHRTRWPLPSTCTVLYSHRV
jgi:hypothetical protein